MKTSLQLGLALAVAAAVAAAGAGHLGVRWNASPSVEPGLYLTREREPARGDLVLFCLPKAVSQWARGRGYLPRGSCPGGSQPLGKRIAGTSGDRIEIGPSSLAVNGHPLEASRRDPRDRAERPVPLAPEGVLILGVQEVWLHSGRHSRSLDSRVFGPLDRSAIDSVLEPLWIFPQEATTR